MTNPGHSSPTMNPSPVMSTLAATGKNKVSVTSKVAVGTGTKAVFVCLTMLTACCSCSWSPMPGLLRLALKRLPLSAPHPLSGTEIARVKHALGLIPGGYAVSQHDYVPDSTPARLIVTGAAIMLALIIVAVAVGLVGAESRREQAILSAVGASPRVRRRLVGANALLMTSLAALLAVPAAMIPMALILISEKPRQPVPTP